MGHPAKLSARIEELVGQRVRFRDGKRRIAGVLVQIGRHYRIGRIRLKLDQLLALIAKNTPTPPKASRNQRNRPTGKHTRRAFA